MFDKNDVQEFITKIIEKTDKANIENAKDSINKFIEYLKLTTMCDEDTIKAISNVACCLEELINIKEKTGSFDIAYMFNINNDQEKSGGEIKRNQVKIKQRKFEDPYQEKHYGSYVPTEHNHVVSICCGGSSSDDSYGRSC